MIEVNCPLCGSAERELLYRCADNLRVQVCSECSLQYLNPRLDEVAVQALYADQDYYSCWQLDREDAATSQLKARTAQLILKLMAERQPGRGHLLEVGCAVGFFLQEALLDNWEVSGVDLSEYAIGLARERLGQQARLHQGLLTANTFGSERFEAVVLLDLIEHVEQPIDFLKMVRQMIVPGGYLYLLTPDADSLSRRLMRGKWAHYKWEHLFYLGHQTTSHLLQAAGWQPESCAGFPKPISFDYIRAHYQTFPHFPFTQIFNLADWCLPQVLKKQVLKLPIGQMLVVAQNPE